MEKRREQSEQEQRKIKKLNNQGMTLMEILVATIIFSMVSAVFLRSFIYAFRLNEEAKQKQYSMILAQSLMESMKAYDLVSLDNQFSGPDSAFRVYSLGPSGTKSFAMTGAEARTYSLSNIVYQQAKFHDRYKYDAEIVVTPSANAAKLVKAQGINPYSDAIYVEGSDGTVEQDVLKDAIRAELTAQGNTASMDTLHTNKISAKRTVKVDISNDDIVTVQSSYEYSVNGYPITKTGGISATVTFTGSVDATEDAIVCYDKPTIGESSVQLINLYLYYYPAYSVSANQLIECTNDKIEITNNSGTLENVYLIKQENPALSSTQISASEGSYLPEVKINSSRKLKLLQNLDKVIRGDSSLAVTVDGNYEDMGAPWKEDTDQTTLLYDVKVTVKKSGESDAICEIIGSTNAK